MKFKLYVRSIEIQRGLFSFIRPIDCEIGNQLDEHVVAGAAVIHGVEMGKSFQHTNDGEGLIIVGKRRKPMAIAVPEGHIKYPGGFILCEMMPPMAKK